MCLLMEVDYEVPLATVKVSYPRSVVQHARRFAERVDGASYIYDHSADAVFLTPRAGCTGVMVTEHTVLLYPLAPRCDAFERLLREALSIGDPTPSRLVLLFSEEVGRRLARRAVDLLAARRVVPLLSEGTLYMVVEGIGEVSMGDYSWLEIRFVDRIDVGAVVDFVSALLSAT